MHYVIATDGPKDSDSYNMGDWNCFQTQGEAEAARSELQAQIVSADGTATLVIEECAGECYGHRFAHITDCPHIGEHETGAFERTHAPDWVAAVEAARES